MLVWWFSEGVLGRSVQPACAGSHKYGANQSFPNYLCAPLPLSFPCKVAEPEDLYGEKAWSQQPLSL